MSSYISSLLVSSLIPIALCCKHRGAFTNIVQDGKLLPAALAAKQRGVIFDVGHGGGSFDFTVAEVAIPGACAPDTISSDIHVFSGNSPGMPYLPWVMSKFLTLGYSLEQVVTMATSVFQCGRPVLWRRRQLPNFSGVFRWWRRVVPRAFGVLVGHLPSAILSLPAFASRSPPDNSCMYPSWINRSLCLAGIVGCIKPLAQSRNETNSSWVNGADKS